MYKTNKPKTQQSASPVQYFAPATSARRCIQTSLKQTSCHKSYPNSNLEIQNNQIKFDSPTCLNVCLAAAKDPWAAELPGWQPKTKTLSSWNPTYKCLNPAALRNKKTCQATPPGLSLHMGANRQMTALGGKNERNILEETLPHSNDLQLEPSAWLTPLCVSTHMCCVCVYIYIYIYS